MSRDYRKLRVFQLADALVLKVYRITENFPASERFGLQGQTRRAAVSAVNNIVEGAYRRSTWDFIHFLEIAMSSAAEVEHLLGVSHRVGYLRESDATLLRNRYVSLLKSLQKLISSLVEDEKRAEAMRRKAPKSRSRRP